MLPPPFDPGNPQPPGRFRITSASHFNEVTQIETCTATCTVHGEIYRIVMPAWYWWRDTMNKLRPALFKDHIARFHDSSR